MSRERTRLRRIKNLRAKSKPQRRRNRFSIVGFYARKNEIIPLKAFAKKRVVEYPNCFSFIEAPDEALGVLNDLVRFSLRRRSEILTLAQRKCQTIDLCAESAAGVFAVEGFRRYKIGFRGNYPDSSDLQEIVEAVGVPKTLGLEIPNPQGFVKFELRRGAKAAKESAVRSSERERQTDLFCRYVNQCIGAYSARLSDDSEEHLASLVSEVIGNAEDHSSRPHWWMAGYLRQLAGSPFGDCHVTIFNFGRTLYESLSELPNDSVLRRDIVQLVREHGGKGLFGAKWTEENLWTLYALQEGVSRHNKGTDRIGDRGQGTADMISFFQSLGQSKAAARPPMMCVVSGRTHFLFDGTFKMKLQNTPRGEQRRIIAFNDSNDLRDPPDARYVTNLNHFFPGTLISMRFFLDKAHLASIGGSNVSPN